MHTLIRDISPEEEIYFFVKSGDDLMMVHGIKQLEALKLTKRVMLLTNFIPVKIEGPWVWLFPSVEFKNGFYYDLVFGPPFKVPNNALMKYVDPPQPPTRLWEIMYKIAYQYIIDRNTYLFFQSDNILLDGGLILVVDKDYVTDQKTFDIRKNKGK